MGRRLPASIPLASAVIAVALAACGESKNIDQYGSNPPLPEQQRGLLPAMNIAPPANWGEARPTAPEGYVVTALATDLQIPRQMLVLPNGDILVAEGAGGGDAPKLRPKDFIAGLIKAVGKSKVKGGDRITLLRDADGDGRTELRSVLVDELNAPYGLAYVNGALYVANQDALMRYPLTPGQTQITAPGVEVTTLPSEINHHWTKALTASPNGSRLYVGIGSNSNIGERGMIAEVGRAEIWEIDPATGAHRPYATGLRNPTALAFHPQTGQLWAAVNERDELGANLVPDYITSVRDGAFYGWPYTYWGQNVDPRPRPWDAKKAAKAIRPDYSLGSHVAALGLDFSNGRFSGRFASGAFVGEHGSWNRGDLAGYKVVFVPFRDGRPSGEPIDFLTGFLDGEGNARGRPVGVAVHPSGALLVADDLSNTVWRVAPTRPAPQEPAAS
jgi:glucose/arabinose dehydrogenase